MRIDTPYEQQIERDFRAMWDLLNTIEAPAGHHWTLGATNPLRWYGGSIAESTRFNASIRVRREVMDDYDPRQLHIEVRLGWDEVGRIGRTTLPTARRSILWCEMGPRINFTSTSLIDGPALFHSAEDVETLFEQLRDILVPALSVYRERLAAIGPDTTVVPAP